MFRLLRTPVLVIPLVAVVAGCGDQTEPQPRASTEDVAATPEAEREPARAAVTIKRFAYSPARVTVRRGGRVTWTDEDASNHTVTFAKDGPRDVENIREGRRATVTFKERGSYAYICEFHPGMAGTVEVR